MRENESDSESTVPRFTPARAMRARRPGFSVLFNRSRPRFNRYLFSPVSGATSATVPRAARSSRWSGEGLPRAAQRAWTSLKDRPAPVRSP